MVLCDLAILSGGHCRALHFGSLVLLVLRIKGTVCHTGAAIVPTGKRWHIGGEFNRVDTYKGAAEVQERPQGLVMTLGLEQEGVANASGTQVKERGDLGSHQGQRTPARSCDL